MASPFTFPEESAFRTDNLQQIIFNNSGHLKTVWEKWLSHIFSSSVFVSSLLFVRVSVLFWFILEDTYWSSEQSQEPVLFVPRWFYGRKWSSTARDPPTACSHVCLLPLSKAHSHRAVQASVTMRFSYITFLVGFDFKVI